MVHWDGLGARAKSLWIGAGGQWYFHCGLEPCPELRGIESGATKSKKLLLPSSEEGIGWGFSMKTAFAVILVACLLSIGCFAQDSSHFKSVGGNYGRELISSIKTNETAAKTTSSSNQSSMWSWGGSPKGTVVVDGNLVGDPVYSMKKLNVVHNWLDESLTDPYSKTPTEYSYTDATTGEPVTTYIDPTTGLYYYKYTDTVSGKLIYVYFDPTTGTPLRASFAPESEEQSKNASFSLPPIFT
jgi:hypothetical protein